MRVGSGVILFQLAGFLTSALADFYFAKHTYIKETIGMFCTLYQNRMNQEITAMPIRVMSDTSEVVPYQNPRIPIFIGGTRVSNSVKDRMLCHWHEDMEMLLVTDGVLTYSVNGEKYRLKKDEGVVVNSRQLHYGYSVDTKGADYLCVLCSPSLLSGSKEIRDRK